VLTPPPLRSLGSDAGKGHKEEREGGEGPGFELTWHASSFPLLALALATRHVRQDQRCTAGRRRGESAGRKPGTQVQGH